MIKTVGFRKDKDSKIVEDIFVFKPLEVSVGIADYEMHQLINYLKNGTVILSLTFAMFEGSDYIGPYYIYTDGLWIWPSHLKFYVEKRNFDYLSNDFLFDLRKREFRTSELNEYQKKKAQEFLRDKMLKGMNRK